MRWQWSSFSDLDIHTLYAVLRLRQEVFVVEQTCPYLDADGADARAFHLLAWSDDTLAAYLRVFAPGTTSHPEAVIGRVIVARPFRGRGLSRELMHRAHDHIDQLFGPTPIFLSAQAHLEGLYGSVGYRVCGPGYDEDDIPHLPMRRPGAR
jgi:ElaA protein